MLGMRANYCSSIVTISKEIYVQWATKIFVRMLAVHCYQNDSYEITINGLQARKL